MDWHKLLAGAVSGALGGLVVDVNAYLSWAKLHDGTSYDWSIAGARVLQGAIAGALAAAGVGAVS